MRAVLMALLLISVSIPLAVSALLAVYTNNKDEASKWYFLLAICCVLWVASLFIADYRIDSVEVLLDKIAALMGLLTTVTFFLFCNSLTSKKLNLLKPLLAGAVLIDVYNLLLTENYGIRIINGNIAYFTPGSGYLLNVLVIFGTLLLSLLNLKLFASDRYKNKTKTIFLGSSISVMMIMLSELYFVLFKDNIAVNIVYDLINGLAVLFFALAAFVSITKYQLIDFRLDVLPKIFYHLAGVAFILLNCLTVLLAVHLLYPMLGIAKGYILLLIFLCIYYLVYPLLKRSFKCVTKNIFGKYTYDINSVIVEMVSRLHKSYKLEYIYREVTALIMKYTDPDSIFISTFDNKTIVEIANYRVNSILTKADLKKYYEMLSGVCEVYVCNSADKCSPIVVIPIVDKEFSTYIFLGRKKSETYYNRRDMVFFNTLLNNLPLALNNAVQYKKIDNFNKTLKEKIKTATAELKTSNANLVKMNNYKDEFIAIASHQLLPKLSASNGLLEMVNCQSESTKEVVDLLIANNNSMLLQVKNLLNVSVIKNSEIKVNKTEVDMNGLINNELHKQSFYLKPKNLNFKFETFESSPIVTDGFLLSEIVSNIINNAIKYSLPNTEILVKHYEHKQFRHLVVQNEGPSIQGKELKKIFKKYYRTSYANKHEPKGSGLGLHIVSVFSKIINANLGVENTSNGVLFRLSLPLNNNQV